MTDWCLSHEWETGSGVVRWASFGQGPPVVLVHGTPFSSFIWRDVAPALARNHIVHVWDMLGFGESDKDAPDVSLAAQTTIFCGLLRHWGVHRPWVIAHDVGGVVALRAALVGGVEFSGLTLIDAASVSGWGAGGFFQTVRANHQIFSQLPDWATDALIAAKIQSGSHLGLRPEALRAYMDQWQTPQGRQAFYRQYAQGGEEHTDEFQGRLATLSMPVHVIWGSHDQWLGLDYAHRLVRALPAGTRFDVVGGAGHMVPEDRPGALLSCLAA